MLHACSAFSFCGSTQLEVRKHSSSRVLVFENSHFEIGMAAFALEAHYG